MSEISPQPQDKYVLRLPDGMRERLKHEALMNNRSLNAEIISRLEQTLEYEVVMKDWQNTKNELGPVADYIDNKIGSVLSAIDDLKGDLDRELFSKWKNERK